MKITDNNRRRRFYMGIAAAAAVFFVGTYYHIDNSNPNEASLQSKDSSKSLTSVAIRPVASADFRAKEPENTPTAKSLPVDWYKAFSSDNPYPTAVALQAIREPGSFGASFSITAVCVEANLALVSPTSSLDQATNDTNYQQRLAAKNLIQSRCSSFEGDPFIALTKPLPGDSSGIRLMAAKGDLLDSMLKSKSQIQGAIQELADQGQLIYAAPWLSVRAEWRGKSWHSKREVFAEAVNIAKLRATSKPDMEANDIRLALRCLRMGRCGGYDTMPAHFTDEMKQEALVLSKDIEEAFRNGDTSAILGP